MPKEQINIPKSTLRQEKTTANVESDLNDHCEQLADMGEGRREPLHVHRKLKRIYTSYKAIDCI